MRSTLGERRRHCQPCLVSRSLAARSACSARVYTTTGVCRPSPACRSVGAQFSASSSCRPSGRKSVFKTHTDSHAASTETASPACTLAPVPSRVTAAACRRCNTPRCPTRLSRGQTRPSDFSSFVPGAPIFSPLPPPDRMYLCPSQRLSLCMSPRTALDHLLSSSSSSCSSSSS